MTYSFIKILLRYEWEKALPCVFVYASRITNIKEFSDLLLPWRIFKNLRSAIELTSQFTFSCKHHADGGTLILSFCFWQTFVEIPWANESIRWSHRSLWETFLIHFSKRDLLSEMSANAGIPQGTVAIGRVLFKIFVSNVPHLLRVCGWHTYLLDHMQGTLTYV